AGGRSGADVCGRGRRGRGRGAGDAGSGAGAAASARAAAVVAGACGGLLACGDCRDHRAGGGEHPAAAVSRAAAHDATDREKGGRMLRACAREQELAEAVRSGRWPLGCEPELRAHVEGCRRCGEMAMLTAAFQQARAQAVGAADLTRAGLPNAGLLWWRAQLRRRNAAMARVNRPLAGAQGFALLAMVIAV